MKAEDDEMISAQVILRSAAGDTPGPTSEVTTRTLHRYTPSLETTSKATGAFEKLGFQVGPFVGIAFSITGPSHLFQEVFDVQVERGEDRVLIGTGTDGVTGPELPTGALPAELNRLIASVVFETPSKLM